MPKSKKLYVGPIPLPLDREIDIQQNLNPGIGGTEFQLLSLAKELSRLEDLQVVVLLWSGSKEPKNSKGGLLFEYYSEKIRPRKSDVVISPISSLVKLPREFTKSSFVIASSHHPHDHGIKKVRKNHKVDLVRSVGVYAYESNRIFVRRGVYLPNLFLSELRTELSDKRESKILGSISSMHPSKGSHHVALLSSIVLKKYNTLGLEFIGSRSLYANHDKADRRETSGLDERLDWSLSFLSSQSLRDRVSFRGLEISGLAHSIDRWKFGVQNPIGIGEADPASVKDLISRGVPVFSSGFFGMWDYMRLFPETRAFWPGTFRKKMRRLLEDEGLENKVRERCLALAKRLERRNEEILRAWVKVISEGRRSHLNIEFSLYPEEVSRLRKLQIVFLSTLLYFETVSNTFFGLLDRLYSLVLLTDFYFSSLIQSLPQNRYER